MSVEPQQSKQPLEVFTDQEVADRLKVTRWTIRNAHRCGKLKGIVIGRHLRFSCEAVEEFVRKLESSER